MNVTQSDAASVSPSVAPSVTPSVTPSVKQQFGAYEDQFRTIDSELDAIRTSFDLNPDGERFDLSVLEIRINELEGAEKKLLDQRHHLHKMLLTEKERLNQIREEERIKLLQDDDRIDKFIIQKEAPKAEPQSLMDMTSPSHRRASEFRTSGGLSELSKQLNISQAKMEAQGIEINRLERQLRLLADLQGVNVSDLRRTLEQACADEAFGELQHRIAKLQAELEASNLMRKGPMPTDRLFEEDTTGTNEEIDALKFQVQQQQMEISRLQAIIEERDRHISELSADHLEKVESMDSGVSALKFQVQQQQIEISRLQEIIEERDKHISEMSADYPNKLKSMDSGVSAMTREYEDLLGLVAAKEEELEAERAKTLERERQLFLNNEKARQMEIMEEKERHFEHVLALERKVIRTENSCDARLKDMEQQLKSLYAVVGVINEDHNAYNEHRHRLSKDLQDADSKVARQMNDAQQNRTTQGEGLYSTLLMNELTTMKQEFARGDTVVPAAAAIAPEPIQAMAFAMTGNLVVKGSGVIRKWKSKQSRLFLCGDHYQWDVGDRSYPLQFGISKVDFNPNYPLSFVVQTDPNDVHAPIVAAAASNEEDYHQWMSALGKATNGEG